LGIKHSLYTGCLISRGMGSSTQQPALLDRSGTVPRSSSTARCRRSRNQRSLARPGCGAAKVTNNCAHSFALNAYCASEYFLSKSDRHPVPQKAQRLALSRHRSAANRASRVGGENASTDGDLGASAIDPERHAPRYTIGICRSLRLWESCRQRSSPLAAIPAIKAVRWWSNYSVRRREGLCRLESGGRQVLDAFARVRRCGKVRRPFKPHHILRRIIP